MNDVGNIAYRKLASCGEYRFDPEGKTYYNGTEAVGKWIKTDTKVLYIYPTAKFFLIIVCG